MLKMRGLTLLCLSGFILTASSVNRDKKEFRSQTYIKTGMLVPMNNGDSNTTTNSSMILEQSRQDNTSAELDGFLQPFVNSDGEDTQKTPPTDMAIIKQLYAQTGGSFVIKMRGIILLCLVGFILSASWPEGGMVPLAKPTRAPHSIWNFLNSDSSFPPEEKVIQNKNEDGQ